MRGSPFALLIPALVGMAASVAGDDLANDPEFQRIGARLQEAHANKDHWNTYSYAMQAYGKIKADLFVDLAVGAVYQSIDMSKAETTPHAGISAKWVQRAAECPKPGDGSDALHHFQFFMIQVCLACYAGNVEHDFDTAINPAIK